MITLRYLNAFYKQFEKTKNIRPVHLSLYMAIYREWYFSGFKNPVSINRKDLMKASKIQSASTYHKCLKDLNSAGLIKYQPSFHPFKGSAVFMKKY